MLNRSLRVITTTGSRRGPRCSQAVKAWRTQAWTVRRNLRRLLTAPEAKPGIQPSAGGRIGDHRLQRLEAVLFLSKEPLTTRKLSQYANLADATEARTLIRRLNELYDTNGRSFRVERVAGGYQLLTRPQFAAGYDDWTTFRTKIDCPLRRLKPCRSSRIVNPFCGPKSRRFGASTAGRFFDS
jgi:hypothetical protein